MHGNHEGRGRRFAGGFGGGMGGRGLRSGRKLGGKDLQVVILALLAEAPAHGYELIRKLEEHSAGFYTPSPGVVYPALTYLEELGQAVVETEGNKKRYSLTDIGRGRLAAHREVADGVLAELARVGARMERARRAFDGEEAGAEAGDDEDDAVAGELHAARHALKHALYDTLPACSGEQLERIAAILRRAADEIRALRQPEQPA
ncbi:PadR family transcriptional regulator [Azoarcus sp. TTM-91]|uniref:PadR family transcriptional regulator n=1 Tax=Azoarcus sp. TTM-91 TaxID=2691581 RepID=UPI00145F73B1|nr:PadR family transcriptional regulator [Azoarcus sp. TTM-91]NMG37261.1 PadR family transcriptional regulator [Azoarcus sp. TTM-91]